VLPFGPIWAGFCLRTEIEADLPNVILNKLGWLIISKICNRRIKVSTLRILISYQIMLPITVAEQFKAWTVFHHSNKEIVDSNPTKDKDVVCLFCCLSYVKEVVLLGAHPPCKESYRLCTRLKHWNATKAQQWAVDPLTILKINKFKCILSIQLNTRTLYDLHSQLKNVYCKQIITILFILGKTTIHEFSVAP
jgi:hypothetical protein